jgi:hypothetical protein
MIEWAIWLASANSILEEWPRCDWWLALVNGILEGWSCYGWWLTSAKGILEGWSGFVRWLITINDIQEGCPGLNIVIIFGSWWNDIEFITYARSNERIIFF